MMRTPLLFLTDNRWLRIQLNQQRDRDQTKNLTGISADAVRGGGSGVANYLATVPTPEPMPMVLLGTGLAGMLGAIRKRKNRG